MKNSLITPIAIVLLLLSFNHTIYAWNGMEWNANAKVTC